MTAGDVPVGAVDATFGEALALIAKLPLTKAEKADAVRRLLAGRGVDQPAKPSTADSHGSGGGQ